MPDAKPSNSGMFARMRAVVRRIPKGKVATYGDVARVAGFPTGARQAAWCLKGAGPELPWHRVLGHGGRILLRGENGVEQWQRLEAEGVEVRGLRVDLARFAHWKWPRKKPKQRP